MGRERLIFMSYHLVRPTCKGLTKAIGFLVGVAFVLSMTPPVYAQSQSGRTIDEPFRLTMDQQPAGKRALFDGGGWLRTSYWGMDDNVDRNRDDGISDDGKHGLRRQQLRLWGDATLDGAHHVYARGLLDYYDWNHGTSYRSDDNYWDEAVLERGWYKFRWSALPQVTPGDFDWSAQIGRQYVEFGTGLALSLPLDAVVGRGYYNDWEVTGMMAKSIASTRNYDHFVPGNDREHRCFWGTELRYNRWKDQRPFVYFYKQNDQDGGLVREYVPGDPNTLQSFGYDSSYVGMGSRGRFFHRDLEYTGELVLEQGKSYARGVGDREDIKAWAFDTELRYISPGSHRSQLVAEYLLTSGDGDRYGSPNSSAGGNQAGTDDRGFSAWGYRNTGICLAPLMSNLGMVRLGAATYPFCETGRLNRLQLGTDFFLYHKQDGRGAMSDSVSSERDSFIGHEVDFYLNWRLTSDLAWALYYGFFEPGEAMVDGGLRQTLYTGLTLNF